MPYEYQKQRHYVFLESGQVQFLSIRDRAMKLLGLAGAADCEHLISKETGDVWEMIACVDRLVELGELREITQGVVPGQYRVFVRGPRWAEVLEAA